MLNRAPVTCIGKVVFRNKYRNLRQKYIMPGGNSPYPNNAEPSRRFKIIASTLKDFYYRTYGGFP